MLMLCCSAARISITPIRRHLPSCYSIRLRKHQAAASSTATPASTIVVGFVGNKKHHKCCPHSFRSFIPLPSTVGMATNKGHSLETLEACNEPTAKERAIGRLRRFSRSTSRSRIRGQHTHVSRRPPAPAIAPTVAVGPSGRPHIRRMSDGRLEGSKGAKGADSCQPSTACALAPTVVVGPNGRPHIRRGLELAYWRNEVCPRLKSAHAPQQRDP